MSMRYKIAHVTMRGAFIGDWKVGVVLREDGNVSPLSFQNSCDPLNEYVLYISVTYLARMRKCRAHEQLIKAIVIILLLLLCMLCDLCYAVWIKMLQCYQILRCVYMYLCMLKNDHVVRSSFIIIGIFYNLLTSVDRLHHRY